ncbi:hypothetical protein DEO72_LG10g1210 [Vigna unguiculata]|uniref:Uncharacterized protein n=1 Tax=Vigna unguiculata TaxID=3917 RepID=A0A4D6NDN0_VIGUN|nr:hypothetical protein DEO72_LG10g1210 [Vigna unguiculata]
MHCRSQIHNQNSKLQQYKSSGGGHVPPGAASSQTAWRGSRTGKRTTPYFSSRHRGCWAELLMSPGAHHLETSLLSRYRLAVHIPLPGTMTIQHFMVFLPVSYAVSYLISTRSITVII